MSTKKNIGLRLEAELHKKLKYYAIENVETVTTLVTRILREFFKKVEDRND